MRFTVSGAFRTTGESVELDLDARSSEHARTLANAMGVLVSGIRPARTHQHHHRPERTWGAASICMLLAAMIAWLFAMGAGGQLAMLLFGEYDARDKGWAMVPYFGQITIDRIKALQTQAFGMALLIGLVALVLTSVAFAMRGRE